MRLRVTLVLLLLVAAASGGCVANMGELKEALGATRPAPVVPLAEDPAYLPPLARAQANVTAVLVGVPVRFTSEGTRDPQGLGLELTWVFGDGATARGATVQHAYAAPGEYAVRLTAANDAGLADTATVTLVVAAPGRAPTACFSVLDARGAPAAGTEAGEKLSFDASCSADPDGQPLTYDWDFGAGATSRDAKPAFAFKEPGLHPVKLRVADPTGLVAETTKDVAVDYLATQTGAFDLAGPASRAHAFPLAQGARTLELTLTFPGGLGGNDLSLVLKDPKGRELERTGERTPPGAQDAQVRVLALDAADLRDLPAGEWTAEVARTSGLTVEYTLEIRETF